jgi:hypothetical protein
MLHRSAMIAGSWIALCPAAAFAWGDEGHVITGIIAYDLLKPKAKAKVDALLISDTDTLTATDFPSRATWADKYRIGHRETAEWHFVDLEIDRPDLQTACFNFPGLASGQSASTGPAQDCVVEKIQEFQAELRDPNTPQAEQRLALKFLIHFVGDVHQPLHASDDQDRGGNCIAITPVPGARSANLHAYWDTGVMSALGASAPAIAADLKHDLTTMQVKAWSEGDAGAWARESFMVAKTLSYQLPQRPTCHAPGTVSLAPSYQASAQQAVRTQLEKAGVRIAFVLNQALDR